jgi:HD-GYP domain-containing protein (c-di-GMP phosphodiesterase class II)
LAVCGRFFAAIDILVRTLEARDAYTCGHSLRVRRYCLLLAEARALGPRERWQIGLAAKLHDIGKVGIPESVLNKPGPLTDEERRLVQRHPVLGEQILAPMVRSRAVLAAVRGHHERLDGGGYPDGLAGASISRAARVLAIGDCFDALTSARAYRAALPPSQALDVLRAGAGSQFDPGLVETFAQVVCRLPAPRPVRVTA